jgi:formimidoylglutamate deiminase
VNKLLRFDSLFDSSSWYAPAFVVLDGSGRVLSISSTKPNPILSEKTISGIAIPGFVNAHSHAFQFAMAGMTENLSQGSEADDFWSWRDKMYGLATTLKPEEIADVSRACFAQMLRNGYTSVCEFHYIHHQPGGAEYSKISEVSEAVIEAALEVGIDISLVPILYQTGDVGQPPGDRQKRFIFNDFERFVRMIEDLGSRYRTKSGVAIGVGAHSLRAVPPGPLKELVEFARRNDQQFHIHISEQVREVETVRKAYGQTPIRWFMDQFGGDLKVNLVHATHADADEISLMAKAGVNVVLCPSTEGDLGDGLFSIADFHSKEGLWSIGSDSNLVIDPWYEIRSIDFAERMRLRRRSIICAPGEEAGESIFKRIHRSAKKIRHDLELGMAVGARFDALVLNSEHHAVAGVAPKHLLSALLYAGQPQMIAGRVLGDVFTGVEVMDQAVARQMSPVSRLRRGRWS